MGISFIYQLSLMSNCKSFPACYCIIDENVSLADGEEQEGSML